MSLHPRLVRFGLLLLGLFGLKKMPIANTPAVLSLLDGPVGVDPALHVLWVRFRMMRRIWRINLMRNLGSSGCWI